MLQYEKWCKRCCAYRLYRHKPADQDGSHKIFRCVHCKDPESIAFERVQDHLFAMNEATRVRKKATAGLQSTTSPATNTSPRAAAVGAKSSKP